MKKLILVMVTCAVVLCGCEPASDGKITIGRIDTATLVQDDPKYQELSLAYMKEQTEFRKGLFENLKAAGKDKTKLEAIRKKGRESQKAMDKKWLKKTQEFLETRHSAIKDKAEAIAKRKNIDMVIIDSSKYPTVEWGGVDMTPDMKLALAQDKPKGDEG